ncbi:hypothetical protein M9458_045716, partial [Cirrhinus mrigala]
GQTLREPRAIHGFPLISPQNSRKYARPRHVGQLIIDPRLHISAASIRLANSHPEGICFRAERAPHPT